MSIKIDKMQYQPNGISYTLAFLSIAFNSYYLLTVINNRSIVPTVGIALKILFNIAFILIVFLGMVKVKAYEKKWSYVLFGFGVITLLRIFYIPLRAFAIPSISTLYTIHLIIILLIIAALLISSAVIAYIKCVALEKYLKDQKKVV